MQWSVQFLPDVKADRPANLLPPATPPHGCLMIVTRNRQQRGVPLNRLTQVQTIPDDRHHVRAVPSHGCLQLLIELLRLMEVGNREHFHGYGV